MWTTAFSVQNFADLSSEDWKDIAMELKAKIHPNPFFRIDRGLSSLIKALEQGLDDLSWYEIYTRLTGNRCVDWRWTYGCYPQGSSTLYPIYTYWFSDGLYYVIATSEKVNRDFLIRKSSKYPAMKVDDALKSSFRRVVSHDNEWGFHVEFLLTI